LFEQIKSKINKIRYQRKGSIALEIVIGMLVFILAVSFLLDLIFIGYKMVILSQASSDFTRAMEVQGGISYWAPSAYPSGSYVNSTQMYDSIIAELPGLPGDPTQLWYSVNGGGWQYFSPYDWMSVVPFGQEIQTKIIVPYKWTFTGNFIPGLAWITPSLDVVRTTHSEYWENYSSYTGPLS
jgi:hypothetical protein